MRSRRYLPTLTTLEGRVLADAAPAPAAPTMTWLPSQRWPVSPTRTFLNWVYDTTGVYIEYPDQAPQVSTDQLRMLWYRCGSPGAYEVPTPGL